MADTHDEKADGYGTTRSSLIVLRSAKIPGTLMYIVLDDRAVFDLIDLPEGGNERVRHKAIVTDTQHVIFQFWLARDLWAGGSRMSRWKVNQKQPAPDVVEISDESGIRLMAQTFRTEARKRARATRSSRILARRTPAGRRAGIVRVLAPRI